MNLSAAAWAVTSDTFLHRPLMADLLEGETGWSGQGGACHRRFTPDHGEQETGVRSRYQRPEGSQHHGEKQGPDLPLGTLLGRAGSRQFNSRNLVGTYRQTGDQRGQQLLPLEPQMSVREQVRGRNSTVSHQSLTP